MPNLQQTHTDVNCPWVLSISPNIKCQPVTLWQHMPMTRAWSRNEQGLEIVSHKTTHTTDTTWLPCHAQTRCLAGHTATWSATWSHSITLHCTAVAIGAAPPLAYY
jgi:hypothetical protein